jgi:hypothetical protein
MSSPRSDGAERRIGLPVTGGASFSIVVPRDAVREPEGALPAIDVSQLPGASVPVRVGFRDAASMSVRAVCATAPSRGFAPGVEGIVMARASQIARGAIGDEVERFEASDVRHVGTRFEQRFSATTHHGARVIGKHVLGFAGEARDAIVCSVVCAEPGGARACSALIDAAATEGAWTLAPPPSLVVRAILLAADRPTQAIALLAAIVIALAAIVIARRPRPVAR